MDEYAKAYVLFSKGEKCIGEKKFCEGIDLFRQAYNLVGEDGLTMMGNLLEGLSEYYMTPKKYHKTMCLAYYKSGGYENALEHAMLWRNYVITRGENENEELVGCYKYLALIHMKLKLPEKDLHNIQLETWKEIYVYIRTLFQVYPVFLRNMELPIEYYDKAYSIQKKLKGIEHDETKELKKEIVYFYVEQWTTMQIERFLWIAILFIPLLAVITLLAYGLTLRALTYFTLGVTVFIIWRILHTTFILWLTYRHYQKAIN